MKQTKQPTTIDVLIVEKKSSEQQSTPVSLVIDINTLTNFPEINLIMSALGTKSVDYITKTFSQIMLENYARITGDKRALVYADYMMHPSQYELVDEITLAGAERTTLLKLA